MNLPFHYIHDCRSSYGRLIFPTLKRDRYGKLDWKEVEPILDKYLDERFIVVDLC